MSLKGISLGALGLGACLIWSSTVPVWAQSSPEGLEQRLLDLEIRQRELVEEIEALREQLADAEESLATQSEQKSEQPSEQSSEQTLPADQDVATSGSAVVGHTQRPQGLLLSAEVLLLEPNVAEEMNFAILDPGEALAVSGELATLDYNDSTDVRYNLGYRIGNVDLKASLFQLDSEGEASVVRPEDGFLFTTLTHPTQNDSAETATASTQLEYSTTDLELGYSLQVSHNLDARLFAGLRFADTDQDLAIAYDGVDFAESEVTITRDFSGFGPRIGGDVRWQMGSGFSVFGRAAGSLLVGDATSRYRETDNSGEDLIAELNQTNTDQLLPVAELALGLGWEGQVTDNVGASLSAGYEYQNWFNAYNTSKFLDDSSPGLLTEKTGDISFQGFFIKTGLSLDF